MTKRAISQSPEYLERLDAYRDTRHESLTFEGRLYTQGDTIYVQLPNSEQGSKATFNAYVTPLRGRAYVEVITARDTVNRVVRPEAILRGGKKVV